jgi:hypothetical protein
MADFPIDIWIAIFAQTDWRSIILNTILSKFFYKLLRTENQLLKNLLCCKLKCCHFYDITEDCKKTTAKIIQLIKEKRNKKNVCMQIRSDPFYKGTWVKRIVRRRDNTLRKCIYCRHVFGLIPKMSDHTYIGNNEINPYDYLNTNILSSSFILCIANPNTTVTINKAIISPSLYPISDKFNVRSSHLDNDINFSAVPILLKLKVLFEEEIESSTLTVVLFKNGSCLSFLQQEAPSDYNFYMYTVNTIIPLWFTVVFHSENIEETNAKKKFMSGDSKIENINIDNILKHKSNHFHFNSIKVSEGTKLERSFVAKNPGDCVRKIHTYMESCDILH